MKLWADDSSGAIFSDDRKYRYALWRIFEERKPLIMFIGLNPSTANETQADPTITRVINFAKRWGYGGVYMMNLFGLVSPYPEDLLKTDPMGNNAEWIEKIAPKCADVLFAWGAFKQARERAAEVIARFPDALALKKNRDGSPLHPLYCKGDIVPIRFTELPTESHAEKEES